MDAPIRVLLADDHPLVRAEVLATLAVEPGITVVGEASNGSQVEQMSLELAPDILLLALNMPGPTSIELVTALRVRLPKLHILMLTTYDNTMYVRSLVSAGVAGYILKDELITTVVQAIRTVTGGSMWLSRALVQHLATSLIERPVARTMPSLTNREMAVLQLVVMGNTNHQIATILGISEKTIEKYLSDVFTKLGVATRVEAAVWAVRTGLA